jgi:DHHC palmitoyltransferase
MMRANPVSTTESDGAMKPSSLQHQSQMPSELFVSTTPSNGVYHEQDSTLSSSSTSNSASNNTIYVPMITNVPIGEKICLGKKYNHGNSVFLYRSTISSKVWPFLCILGPDWPCNLFITFPIMILPGFFFLVFLWSRLTAGVIIGEFIVLVNGVLALSCTAFTDPGFVPKGTVESLEIAKAQAIEGGYIDNVTSCSFCNILRNSDIHHCYDCGQCVMELDHHCPWTGTCIGQQNLKMFYWFLASICIQLGYVGVAVVVFFITHVP